jgi:cobalamin transport system ATP-binding protein
VTLLEGRGLGVSYAAREALRDVDVEVSPGEILGVIGPNGSGKSTLVRVLAGVRVPERGEVRLDGRPLQSLTARQRGREIALVPQETTVSFPMRVRDLVLLGRVPHTGPFGWERPSDLLAIHEAMQRTETLELADRPVDELSGGERQRAVLARALAQEPRALLLDEPTAFLDPSHAVLLLDLVRDLCVQHSLGVVVVVHDLNLAAMYCDRLILLSAGAIRACGPPSEVLTYALLCEVYGTELYVAPNDVTGQTIVLPLAREHRERLRLARGLEGGRGGGGEP